MADEEIVVTAKKFGDPVTRPTVNADPSRGLCFATEKFGEGNIKFGAHGCVMPEINRNFATASVGLNAAVSLDKGNTYGPYIEAAAWAYSNVRGDRTGVGASVEICKPTDLRVGPIRLDACAGAQVTSGGGVGPRFGLRAGF